MLNICFTADHELFFGENKVSEEKVFIQPTYKLMEILEYFNIPLNLMTDVCSILRYRELKLDSSYPELMEEQLRQAIARGHDVQLHIHPHWLTSEYKDGKWLFDKDSYRLHSFGFNQNDPQCAQKIIAYGKKYLTDLLTPIDPAYKCIAFRAGGWCIQPEKEILEALIKENIRIDTTVYYGGYNSNPIKYYDFRNVPQKANWWIDPQKGLNYEAKSGQGNLFEVPIGSYNYLPLLAIKRMIYKKYRLQSQGISEELRGTSIDAADKNRWDLFKEKLQNIFFQPIVFSFDAACLKVMMDLVSYYLKHFDSVKQESYISIIGHPKTLSDASLKQIGEFCAEITKRSNLVRFVRLRDIPE